MTDIVKNVELVDSGDLLKHLKANPDLVQSNVENFRRELGDLGAVKLMLLAFGDAAFTLMKRNVPPETYSRLIRLTHYSHQVGKEPYRESVLKEIGTSSETALVGAH